MFLDISKLRETFVRFISNVRFSLACIRRCLITVDRYLAVFPSSFVIQWHIWSKRHFSTDWLIDEDQQMLVSLIVKYHCLKSFMLLGENWKIREIYMALFRPRISGIFAIVVSVKKKVFKWPLIDMTSLYTNIPNSEGIKAVAKCLDKNPPPYTSKKTVLSLLREVLTKNNFSFNGKHYLQIGGTAMGTKLAPSYANIWEI